MNRDVIITCAVTGSGDTGHKHPDLPKTAGESVMAANEAAMAGAAVQTPSPACETPGLRVRERRSKVGAVR